MQELNHPLPGSYETEESFQQWKNACPLKNLGRFLPPIKGNAHPPRIRLSFYIKDGLMSSALPCFCVLVIQAMGLMVRRLKTRKSLQPYPSSPPG
jgi:hypothetical protein